MSPANRFWIQDSLDSGFKIQSKRAGNQAVSASSLDGPHPLPAKAGREKRTVTNLESR
jgi:hypothetical protein